MVVCVLFLCHGLSARNLPAIACLYDIMFNEFASDMQWEARHDERCTQSTGQDSDCQCHHKKCNFSGGPLCNIPGSNKHLLSIKSQASARFIVYSWFVFHLYVWDSAEVLDTLTYL